MTASCSPAGSTLFRQHRSRRVDAMHLEASAGKRESKPSSANAELQQRAIAG